MLMPISEVLWNLATGVDFKLRVKRGFQLGVRIVVPPYPFDDPDTFDNYSKNSLIMFEKANRDGVHIEDVKLQGGQWIVAGNTGVVLVVCGTGTTVKQAQAQAYARIKNILIPSMYYRTDIGDRWFEDCDRLHSWGYLREV
jgi:phosphoribosylamine--glycine ligase